MKFKSDIEVQAGLKDSSGANGTSGQVLSSNGTTVSWVNAGSSAASDVQNQVKAGVAINKGQAVYVTGADGTNIIVGLASNTSEATSSKTLGLLNATVAVNDFADVVQIGKLAGLDTSTATVGDPVWLGTNGNLIYGLANKPYAPAHLVYIGVVTRVNANNGEIFVTVQNGFELKEIHDVDIITTTPVNGDVLGYNGTLWVNKTIPGWLGYTPVTNARTITINGTSQDLSANRSWSVGTVTSVSGTGGYGGLTLSGTVTSSGSLTLGGTPTGTWPISVSGSSNTATSAANLSGSINSATSGISSMKVNDTRYWVTDPNAPGNYFQAITLGNGSDFTQIGVNSSNQMYYRFNGTGSTWYTVLSSNNYTSFAPSLTGTGASGTWGISITGNAATATNATYANSAGTTSSVSTSYIATNADHYITFVDSNNGSPTAETVYTIGTLRYNPNTGVLNAGGDMRAPVFYDSNDTTYYSDLASTSQTATRQRGGTVYGPNTTWGAYLLVGGNGRTGYIDNTLTPSVCATDGNIHLDAASGKTMYLNWYDGSSIIFGSGAESQIGFMSSSGDFTANSSSRSPIFYDSNDTAYYINPADADVSAVLKGTVTIGGGTGGNYDEGLRIIDSGSFSVIAFGASGNAGAGRFNLLKNSSDAFELRNAGGGQIWWTNQSGNTVFNTDVRSPIFYDYNNTGYYVDPASTSNINSITIGSASTAYGGISVVRSGGGSDPYGVLAVSCPSGDNYSYIGLTRNGIIGLGMGIDTSNNFWIGGTGGGHNAVRTSTNILINSGGVQSPVFYDLNNTAYYFDGSSTGDSIRVAGDVVAYYSDERLKDKKGNIQNALEKVLSLNGFHYTPNKKAQKLGYKYKEEVGVSAQEVEAVLPEIIKDAPIGHGYKTLDYGKLTPLLIEAIKEQQSQIEELKELVNKLINK